MELAGRLSLSPSSTKMVRIKKVISSIVVTAKIAIASQGYERDE